MNDQPRRMVGRMSLAFGVALLILGSLLWQVYRQQMASARAEITAELAAIAELKVHELTSWRQERRADGQFLHQDPLLARQVQQFLRDPQALEHRAPLVRFLQTWCRQGAYEGLALTDPQGRVLLAEGHCLDAAEVCLQSNLAQARQRREVVFADLHRSSPTGSIHLAVLVPILQPESLPPTADCLAVLVLHMDPGRFLYPLLQSWPLPSPTAETLLVRREGEEVVYLNELRHYTNTALTLRLPLAQTNLPAALAVLGQSGTLEGLDYRGRQVLSSFRPVPDATWALVAKVDADEIFAPLQMRSRQFGFAGLLLILILGASLFIWRSRSHSNFYKQQLALERERQALVRHFEYLTRFANDAITLANADLKFVEVNERACALYGYAHEEFLRLHVFELRAAAARHDLERTLQGSNLTNGLLLETLHQRKDGSTFPVEVSMRLIEVEGVKYYQAIIRDITERKAHEQEITRLNRLYAALSQVNQSIVRVRSRDELFREVCRVLIEFGQFKMAWVGWWNRQTHLIEPVASHGDDTGYVRKIRVAMDASPEGQGPGATAIREGRAYICNDFAHDPRTLPWREAAAAAGFGASVSLPIRLANEVVGAVQVYASEPNFFGEKEVALLVEAALDISFALDHLASEQLRVQTEKALQESEAHFRTTIEHAASGYFRLDQQGRFAQVNSAWLRMHGFTAPEEVVGQPFALTQLPQDLPAAEQIFERLMAGEVITTGTFSRRGRDGATGYHTFSANPVREQGRITGAEGFLIDITDLKKTEDALRESEVRFHSLFTTMTEGMAVHRMIYDANGQPQDYVILDVNPAFETQTGLSRIAVIGKRATEAYGIPAAPYLENYAKVAQTQEALTIEEYFAPLKKHFRIKVYAPQKGFFATVFEDITERILAHTALRESREHFRQLFDQAPIGYQSLDNEGRFLDVNQTWLAMTGYSREEIIGHWLGDFLTAESRELFPARFAKFMELGEAHGVEFKLQRKDGSLLLASFDGLITHDMDGRFKQTHCVMRDITQTRQAEEQLRLQSAMLQAAANGIVIADRKGQMLWVNEAFTKLTGYSAAEAIGQNPRVLKSGQNENLFYQKLWETILAGEVWHGELINKRKDDTLYTEEMTITPVQDKQGEVSHFIAIKQDVSERRALEESLRQTQKMDSIGRLAGGVAHDFNNVLQTILGFTDLLLTATPVEDKRHSDLLEIQKAGQHAADLTHQLLAFSRKQMITPRVLDLNKILADSEKMLRRLLGEDVHIHMQLDPALPRTVADPGQVHQIIMNLAVNARDAMPNGGDLTFRTSGIEFHEHDLSAMPETQQGYYVCLAVSDTGQGMSREIQEHIFEPFFTTKGLGKGTGLGLAVIYGIVKQSQGWIHVYSQEGLGSTFKIYLPAHMVEPAVAVRPARGTGTALERGQGERLLLVEDEPSVRALAHRVCLKAGYKVTLCVNAQEALDQWEQTGGAFDLLFSDVVLPDFTGIELAERLRARRSTLPVLLCSGYSDERSRWSSIAEKKFNYLQKPYPASTLLQALRQTLAAPPN